MVIKEKPECPEIRKSWYDGTRLCGLRLMTRICLLESSKTCVYYEEWLKDEQKEESDKEDDNGE